jgi:hypothetical protein
MGLTTERVASTCAYLIATFMAWLGGLSLEDIAFLVGSGVGIGTFLVNWYYRRKSYLLLARSGLSKETYERINS